MADANLQNNDTKNSSGSKSDGTPEGKSLVSIPKIRTFSDDVQNAVESGNFSQANIVMAEKKRARDRGENTDEEVTASGNTKNIGLTIGYVFVILLFVAGGFGIFIFFQSNKDAVDSAISQQNTPGGLLPNATKHQLLIEEADNKPQVVEKMNAVLTKIGTEEFTQIVPTKLVINEEGKRADTPISLEDFFEKLLVSDNGFARLTSVYVYGIHKGEHPFLLVQLDDPIESYARLFSWENRMQVDLLPFFSTLNEEKEVIVIENTESTDDSPEVSKDDSKGDMKDVAKDDTKDAVADDEIVVEETDATPSASFTPTATPEFQFIYNPRSAQFSDAVFFNFEGRVVRDSNNKVRLVYALITKNFLVITSNPETLRALSIELKNTSIVR